MRRAQFRDLESELSRFQYRLGVAGAVVVAAFGLLALRFLYLQLVQHDYYRTKAEDNRISVVPDSLTMLLSVDTHSRGCADS